MDDLTKYYKNALLNNLCDEYKGYWRKANGNKSELIMIVMVCMDFPINCMLTIKGIVWTYKVTLVILCGVMG